MSAASERDHGGRRRAWGQWRGTENSGNGGMLLDLVGLAEAYHAATGDTIGPDERDRGRLERALIAVLDAGAERCPHGLPLWVDLSVPSAIRVTPTLVVGDGEDATLRIFAGPALGTGRSPWTALLLELLETHVRPGDVVADVGTGTGILGLRAAALGARAVDAVDLDAMAVAVARRNARANGLTDRFRVVHGTADRLGGPYDLVVVSLGDVTDLPRAVGASTRRLRPGGLLLMSPAEGADEAAEMARTAAAAGLEPLERRSRDGWTVLLARKP